MDNVAGVGAVMDKKEDPGLHRKRRWFRAYETNKRTEMEEAREARKYYHDKQWTEDEIATLKRRGQQPTVRNRTKRKIDFLVGTEQRLRRECPLLVTQTGISAARWNAFERLWVAAAHSIAAISGQLNSRVQVSP